jgi:chromosome segregation ATPase
VKEEEVNRAKDALAGDTQVLRHQIEALKSDKHRLEEESGRVAAANGLLEKDVDQLRSALESAEQSSGDQAGNLAALAGEVEELRRELLAAREAVGAGENELEKSRVALRETEGMARERDDIIERLRSELHGAQSELSAARQDADHARGRSVDDEATIEEMKRSLTAERDRAGALSTSRRHSVWLHRPLVPHMRGIN